MNENIEWLPEDQVAFNHYKEINLCVCKIFTMI
jgi:hypothetical protein